MDGEGMWKEKLDTAQQTGLDEKGMWKENLDTVQRAGGCINARIRPLVRIVLQLGKANGGHLPETGVPTDRASIAVDVHPDRARSIR